MVLVTWLEGGLGEFISESAYQRKVKEVTLR
jgi:hypothetical protein